VNDANPVNDSAVSPSLVLDDHPLPPIDRRFTSFTRFTRWIAVASGSRVYGACSRAALASLRTAVTQGVVSSAKVSIRSSSC
jgi:hypothetical protein